MLSLASDFTDFNATNALKVLSRSKPLQDSSDTESCDAEDCFVESDFKFFWLENLALISNEVVKYFLHCIHRLGLLSHSPTEGKLHL